MTFNVIKPEISASRLCCAKQNEWSMRQNVSITSTGKCYHLFRVAIKLGLPGSGVDLIQYS